MIMKEEAARAVSPCLFGRLAEPKARWLNGGCRFIPLSTVWGEPVGGVGRVGWGVGGEKCYFSPEMLHEACSRPPKQTQ